MIGTVRHVGYKFVAPPIAPLPDTAVAGRMDRDEIRTPERV